MTSIRNKVDISPDVICSAKNADFGIKKLCTITAKITIISQNFRKLVSGSMMKGHCPDRQTESTLNSTSSLRVNRSKFSARILFLQVEAMLSNSVLFVCQIFFQYSRTLLMVVNAPISSFLDSLAMSYLAMAKRFDSC